MKPYIDIKYSSNRFFRIFFPWIKEGDLVWHRDKLDRKVSVLFNKNWFFQYDNKLPFLLNGAIFIEKEEYHRLIKGRGLLLLKIKEQ